jgi:tetratricopeptide (TPR) repeat protein
MLKAHLAALVFLLPALVWADTVYFKESGMKLEGSVLRETDDFIIMVVHEEAGQVRIPKSKIARIEYDVKIQEKRLEPDDFAGRYKLGLWARDKGLLAEAIDLLEVCKGHDGVPPDMLKQLGDIYNKREQKDKALKVYSEYLQANASDAEVRDRVKELTKAVAPAEDAPAKTKKIEQGLEKDGAWVAEQWEGANPSKLTPMTDGTGRKFICVESFGGNKDKVAFSRCGDALNLSESKDIQFRVYLKCPSSIKIAMAFNNGQSKYFESKRKTIAPNSWVPITFDIQAKDFKAEDKDGKWDQIYPLEGKERITKMFFLIYDQRPFTMYIDSIYFSPL